jgi:hypothetical protein
MGEHTQIEKFHLNMQEYAGLCTEPIRNELGLAQAMAIHAWSCTALHCTQVLLLGARRNSYLC